MLSCKEVSKLVSESLDRDLPWYRRLMLRFHMLICTACARYEKQLRFIKENVSRKVTEEKEMEETPPQGLTCDARERMKRILKAAKEKD